VIYDTGNARFNYQRFFYLGDAFWVLLIFILALPSGRAVLDFAAL
jgi:hypothetical protein